MIDISPYSLALVALAVATWIAVLAVHGSRREFNGPHAVALVLYTAVSLACISTVSERAGISSEVRNAISLGVAAFLPLAAITFLAANSWRHHRPGRALLIVSALMSLLGIASLLLNGHSVTTYVGTAVSLLMMPSIISLAASSGATKEQLLAVVFRCASGIMYVSLALAAVAPGLAFGTTNQDIRRIVVGPLSHRLSGVAGHPNFLAFIALVVLVIALSTPVRWRLLHVVASVGTIALAEARNALVSLAIVALVLFVARGISIVRVAFATPVMVLLVIYGTSWSTEDFALTSDVETNGRYRVWEVVLRYFPERPVYGWGPAAFRESAGTPLLESNLVHAHNQLAQSLAEGGIIGLVLIIVFSLLLARIAFRNRREPVYLGLLTILFASFATQVFLTPHLWGGNIGAVPTLLLLPAFVAADTGSSRKSEAHEHDHGAPASTGDAAGRSGVPMRDPVETAATREH